MRKALILTLSGSLLLGGCVAYEHHSYDPGVTPITQGEIVSMTRAGYPESEILERLRRGGVERRPTADEIIALKEQGVSNAVLNALLEAPVTAPRPARETTTVVYDYEPAILLGAAAVFGYLLSRPTKSRIHVHTAFCVH
ncbi:MAG: hypothetical protein ACK44W_08130 [Planctomycetota bacterium]